jgi:poly(A) polymerase
VFQELSKLLASKDPGRGLRTLDDLGLTAVVLPEARAMRACVAGAGRPDVWSHTLAVLDAAARGRRLPGAARAADPETLLALRWAILLHDVAKPETLAHDGTRPTFHGHEVRGARRARAILSRLRAPVRLRRRVERLVLFHLRPHHLADAGVPPRGMRRLVREAGDDLPALVLHAACDARGSGSPDARVRWRKLRPVLASLLEMHLRLGRSPAPPLIDGNEVMRVLGIPPGPRVGEVLRHIRDLQDEGRLTSRQAARRYVAALPR